MTTLKLRLKALTLSGLFLCCQLPVFAGSYIRFGTEAQTTYSHILSLRFEEAEQGILHLQEQHPEDLIHMYLQVALDAAQCLISARELDCRQCLHRGPDYLNAIHNLPLKSPWQYYATGELAALISVVHYLDGSTWKAARQLRQAINHFREGARLYPHFLPLQKNLLILRSMVDAVPEQYIWLAEWVSGLPRITTSDPWTSLIAEMEHQRHFMTLDARLLRIVVDVQIHRDIETASQRVEYLVSSHPHHPVVRFLQAYVARESGRNDLTIKVLKSSDRHTFPYLEFMLGKSLLYRLDVTEAATHFDRFSARWPGHRYRLETCQKRAWCDLLRDDPHAYRNRTATCVTLPVNGQESETQALHEWKEEHPPHTGLLRARLLMDGGYSFRAMEEIDRIRVDSLQSKDRVLEYHYRKGRIAQSLKQQDRAIQALETTWKEGRGGQLQFACAAALYIGHIYADAGNVVQARQWYERCLREKPKLYRQGLHQKARLALRHLEG